MVKPQDDKALKMAALSQALNFFDKFRKDQESKGDKTAGHDAAAELDHLASGLQEAASQGAAGAQVRVVWLRLKSRKKTFFSSDGEESNFPLLQLRRRRKRAGAFAKRIIHFFPRTFKSYVHLQISEVLNEEQQLGKAGEGFCAAVSLNDGELLDI